VCNTRHELFCGLQVVSRNASWAGGRCEDDTPSEASAESAAPVQVLLHQAEAAFAGASSCAK
jgi:hypothetical protein